MAEMVVFHSYCREITALKFKIEWKSANRYSSVGLRMEDQRVQSPNHDDRLYAFK